MKRNRFLSILMTLCLILPMISGITISEAGEPGTYGQTTTYAIPTVTAAAYATDAAIPTDYEINIDTKTVTINTAKGMAWLTQNSDYWGSGYTIKLANDIVCSGFIWSPIGLITSIGFAGTFDGQGHTVGGIYLDKNLYADSMSNNCQGLFGYAFNGSISNVGVINSYIKGRFWIGGIVGMADKETITNCWNSGDIISNNYSGGIVGQYYGYNIKNCYNIGTITSNIGAGGIVGQNYGNVTNCYNTGAVSGTTPTVENTGYGRMVGGVVGGQFGGSIASCYYLNGCATDGSGKIQTGIGTDVINAAAEDANAQTNAFKAFDDPIAPGTLYKETAYTITNSAGTTEQRIEANSSLITALNTWVKSTTYYTWTATSSYPILDALYVAPPTITSATYDANAGVLVVTGADMNSDDTIAVNKLTLKGEGGSTYTLTTSNVTASSSTAYSVTLNAVDKAAVNQILNKNGSSATGGTTYNLAAVDDWDASITAGDSSDATNAITVSNANTITSLSRQTPASGVTSAAAVTYRATFAIGVPDLVASNFDLVSTISGVTITAVSEVSGTSNVQWDITVNTGTGDGTITLRLENGTGLTPAISTTMPYSGQTYTLDKSAPNAPTVTAPSNASATSDTTPSFSGAAEASSTVTVYIDGASDGTTTASGEGNWSYALGSALTEDTYTVKATATDAAGNTSTASAINTFRVDMTAPDAPTITAPANGSSTSVTTPSCSGTAEAASTVTVYIDGTSAGTTTASGEGNWSYALGSALSVASHTVKATATDGAGNISTDSAISTFTVTAPAAGSSGGSKEAVMLVDGQQRSVGTLTNGTNADGQNVTTVTLDETKLNQFIDATDSSPTVIISVVSDSDVIDVKLNGIMVNNLEDKNVTLEIQTDLGSYTLPVSDIDIQSILQQFGEAATLGDIQVSIQIAEPLAETVQVVQDAAKEGEFTIVVPAVDFTVTATYKGQTISLPSYDAYAQRTVAIPEGVDPTKITTGVIVEPDGTVNHVPTHVTIIDGKYYAVINSLTNSTYTVIWHPVAFADVTSKWAKDAINDMGSRMVVSGVDEKNYEPNRDITRAEFAVIVARALGLKPAAFAGSFRDVKRTDWFCGYTETAASYNLISGYANSTFGPKGKITREQAMSIIARAMVVTKLTSAGLTESQVSALLSGYKDGASVSGWAAAGIAECIKTGIVSGNSSGALNPKDNITRAEVAVIVQRLLQKSNLI